VYDDLAAWCRARDYAGHDPFDALNSRLFQATPLRRSRLARLAWTQLFKRSPVNLRPLARVPPERNAKGTALFALAWLSQLRAVGIDDQSCDEAKRAATTLLGDLIDARIGTAHGAAWGYNFDWQGRAFFAPRGTPTVVPTAFAARALVEASRELGDEKYLRLARAACDFFLRDLNRSDETADELCFSYSPLDRTRVFNASLLAAETLARVGALTNEDELKDTAIRAALYVVRRQRADGSWAYGTQGFQSWSDNFHTAFVLTSLSRIIDACEESRDEFLPSLQRGFDFWRDNFFAADGFPKFLPDRAYPADAHSTGAALVALAELQDLSPDARSLAEKIAGWAIANLRDPRGFFYYQRRRTHTVRTPYMRWSQGWMMYGLARLLEVSSKR
jgi:rhamnogalacturonyl hydrolase YesR